MQCPAQHNNAMSINLKAFSFANKNVLPNITYAWPVQWRVVVGVQCQIYTCGWMNESLAYLSPQCAGNAFNFGEREKKKRNISTRWQGLGVERSPRRLGTPEI